MTAAGTTATTLRTPTLQTLGLGGVLDIFRNGRLPVAAGEMVERVFGPEGRRGALVISGASGIVGAGKTMQLGSRLQPFGVPVVALDLPGAPDGLGRQYPGLVRAFGRERANAIMGSSVRLTYDGASLPGRLADFRPRFLLEAIPEILELKRAHYAMFRSAFPEIEIRSVTSGFPSRELGVAIAHPAFPHEVNKVFETVESGPSEIPRLLWSLGLVPAPVADAWSFVLDVIFCGLTNAATLYHRASNMPFWKIDKLVRRLLGPNPFRAHDAIGAAGANFLTWSCLHHLSGIYGELFTPAPELVAHKDAKQEWYPPNHLRPVVDWSLDDGEAAGFETWILGPLVQMSALMLHERRAHLALLNAIGEQCAQLRHGVLALIRARGVDAARALVDGFHALHPAAAQHWHPEALDVLDTPEGRQLYVNAEHDGRIGVVTLGREAYNWDVDAELNRALDWLLAAGVERVILTGDFHLATQLVGADTAEFFPAFEDAQAGRRVSEAWTRTARRLHGDFAVSVGVIAGKRCLGGMLELMLHCHYVLAASDASLGFPEVTLPVVPGMEACHWPFRRVSRQAWPELVRLLLDGRELPARATEGWLIDRADGLESVLRLAWALAGGAGGIEKRAVVDAALDGFSEAAPLPAPTGDSARDAARQAIYAAVTASTAATLGEALEVQATHSAGFFGEQACRRGAVGTAWSKTLKV